MNWFRRRKLRRDIERRAKEIGERYTFQRIDGSAVVYDPMDLLAGSRDRAEAIAAWPWFDEKWGWSETRPGVYTVTRYSRPNYFLPDPEQGLFAAVPA